MMGSRTCGTEGYEKAEVNSRGVDTDEYRAGRWKAGESPDCFSSGVVDVTAIWAASTFMGLGLRRGGGRVV